MRTWEAGYRNEPRQRTTPAWRQSETPSQNKQIKNNNNKKKPLKKLTKVTALKTILAIIFGIYTINQRDKQTRKKMVESFCGYASFLILTTHQSRLEGSRPKFSMWI